MECLNCKENFIGRRNQLYCSSRCKSDMNNQRIAERDADIIEAEKKMRKNRRILAMLHGLYKDQALPRFVLDNTEFDADYFTGVGENSVFMCYDFGIQKINAKEFKIIKL